MSLSKRFLKRVKEKEAVKKTTDVIDLRDAESCLMWDVMDEWVREVREEHPFDKDKCLPYGRCVGDDYTLQIFAHVANKFVFKTTSGGISKDDIVIFDGATGTCQWLPYLFCDYDQGDVICVPSPYYYGFVLYFSERFPTKIIGCARDYDPQATNPEFTLNIERLRETVAQEKVKCLVICNPNNPIGCMYTREQLQEVLDLCLEYDIHVVSDEVFANCVVDGEFTSIYSLVLSEEDVKRKQELEKRVHVVYSLSKDFGVSGFRVGFFISRNAEITQTLRDLGQLQSNSKDTLYLVSNMFTDDDKIASFLTESVSRLRQRIADIVEIFDQHKDIAKYVLPKAGLFVFFKLACVATWDEEEEFYEELKEKKKVIVFKGQLFDTPEPGWYRIIIASHNLRDTKEAVNRIMELAHEWKERKGKKKKKWGLSSKEKTRTVDLTLRNLDVETARRVLDFLKK